MRLFSRAPLRKATITCVAVVLSVVIVDKVCALFGSAEYASRSLALPPLETSRTELRDFQFTVSTNRLGFRGPEFPIRRTPGVKRILVLGNSFTYGYGVDFELTWPHLLEKELNALGTRVEVANLAPPGVTSLQMRDIAARAIPLLKPDLVIVSVLQGGALVTLQGGLDAVPERERPKNIRGVLVSGLDHVIPHYVELLRVVRRSLANEKFASRSAVQRKQRLQVEQFVSTMTELERQRMNAIDRATLDRFFDGSLNIGIVVASIQTPNYFVDPVESPKVIDNGVTGMRNLFSAIRTISEENGAEVVVASMPYGAYLGGAAAENIRRLGFNVPDFLERDRSTEDQVSRAAAGAGVPFISVLDGFQAVRNDNLFIPFDGHYSAAGTKLYADLLSKELMHLSPLLARTDN